MSTNQTIDGVPRKAIEQALLAMKRIYQAGYDRIIECGGKCDTPEYMMAGDLTAIELRALLDATEKLPLIDVHNERLIASLRKRVKELEAAQLQGDPFGYWLFPKGLPLHGMFHRVTESDKVIDSRSVVEAFEITPLYAEQPAPVAAPLDYGSLDAAQRLAVCRGELATPVAVLLPERLQQILRFLDGAENLDGHWFGETHPSGRPYWWRNELRKALTETNLFAKQL